MSPAYTRDARVSRPQITAAWITQDASTSQMDTLPPANCTGAQKILTMGHRVENTATGPEGTAPTTQETRYPAMVSSITGPVASPASSMPEQQAPATPPIRDMVRYPSPRDTSSTSSTPAACHRSSCTRGTAASRPDSCFCSTPGPSSPAVSPQDTPRPASMASSHPKVKAITARIFPASRAMGFTLTSSSSTSRESFSSTTARIT